MKNILRQHRKSKGKKKAKKYILFIFTLIMTTFAWFAYSKVLEYIASISFEEAHERMQSENYANFFEKLEEVFKEVPFRNGITYSKLEEIMSVIKIPKICK